MFHSGIGGRPDATEDAVLYHSQALLDDKPIGLRLATAEVAAGLESVVVIN